PAPRLTALPPALHDALPISLLAVNGKRTEGELTPGNFLALARTWKDGDRVEFEVAMPLRLEAVDDATPNTVALVRGPLALFAIGDRKSTRLNSSHQISSYAV